MKKYLSRVQRTQRTLYAWALSNPPRLVSQLAKCSVLSGALLGCAQHNQQAKDEAFHKIQVHEATLAEASAQLHKGPSCEHATQLSDHVICTEAKALCRVAERLDDADALHRCLIADDTCRGARERLEKICATPRTHD